VDWFYRYFLVVAEIFNAVRVFARTPHQERVMSSKTLDVLF